MNDGKDISNIAFRDKTNGWQNYNVAIKSKSSTIKEPFYSNQFMQGFLANIYLRPSCYSCPAKCGRCGSDITLGDFWGINNYHPEINDDKGISAVLAYTEKGKRILKQLEIDCIPSNYESVLAGNPSLERSVAMHVKRELFFNSQGSFSKRLEKCFKQPLTTRLKRMIASMLTQSIKRIIKRLK